VYNIVEPAIARELQALKVARIAESGARVVATGNPGCLMQIAQGVRARGLDVAVAHPVELLARSVEWEAI
jgi:glycolate oxidase iron-sulfur subunit